MGADRLDLLLKKYSSGVLAIFTLMGATIVMWVVGGFLLQFDKGSYIAYTLNGLIITTCCFFIVRGNPKSILYVPLISNSITILSAFVEPSFWQTPMWIPICGGWALTIIGSIVATLIGNSKRLHQKD